MATLTVPSLIIDRLIDELEHAARAVRDPEPDLAQLRAHIDDSLSCGLALLETLPEAAVVD